MEKTKLQILNEKKIEKRTFRVDTAFARLEDRITELESRIDELEANK